MPYYNHNTYNQHYHRLIVYFDGASKNNPRGPAGCGWTLYEMDRNGADRDFLACGQRYLGHNVSNNQAEYEGLASALDYILQQNISCHGLYIRGDSEIVINQLDGCYNVRSPNIIDHYNEVTDCIQAVRCDFVNYTHVARSRNWMADQLANEAIDHQVDGAYEDFD
jgi:ribonuclease HI